MPDRSGNVGAKLGLVAALLLIAASALLFDIIYRGPANPAGSLPATDRLLVVTLGGDRPVARTRSAPHRAPHRAIPARRAPDDVTQREAERRREEAPPRVRRYQVRNGQSLCEISDEVYGTEGRWKDIARENGIQEPWVINPGQSLRLPD